MNSRIRQRGRRLNKASVRSFVVQVTFVIIAVSLWAVISGFKIVDESLIPTIGSTVDAVRELVLTADGLHHLRVSLGELLGAFVLATFFGVIVGFAVSEAQLKRERAGKLANTVLITLLATPKFVFLPVFIAVLGASYLQKVSYVMLEGMTIIALTMIAAGYNADRQARLLSRSLGATRVQFLAKFYMPAVLPPLVEALRLSVILMMGGVLLAEMYVSSAGVGYMMSIWGMQYNLPALFSAVIVLGSVAIIVNLVFKAIERRLSLWRIEA